MHTHNIISIIIHTYINIKNKMFYQLSMEKDTSCLQVTILQLHWFLAHCFSWFWSIIVKTHIRIEEMFKSLFVSHQVLGVCYVY